MAVSSEQWGNFSETKKLSDMWWKATMPGSEKIWKREKKRAQNPTNITHPSDQGKKREKYRVSVHCLSFE